MRSGRSDDPLMGTMRLTLPGGMTAKTAGELQRAYMAGGPDNMPWPTALHLTPAQMTATRDLDDSGYLVAPWPIAGAGRLMGATATLMERPHPYQFLVELARGKINQLRGQAYDWQMLRLQIPAALQQEIRGAASALGRAIALAATDDVNREAQTALDLAYDVADRLVHTYIDQVFSIRRQRQPRLESTLGCRLGVIPPSPEATALVKETFNAVHLPLAWNLVEAEEATYNWQPHDAVLTWAEANGLPVIAGPLIDFSSLQLPAWLWLWERDLPNMAGFMCKFVEAAVRRYRHRIRRWQLTAASNFASVLSLTEDELLGLTYRLAEAARQIDPTLEIVVGVSQPWGEYMATVERIHSPFVFADTLIRSGMNLAALDVELVMGPTPRGSYCRDLLEASRLLDLYAQLSVPLRVTLGYPSASAADLDADPEMHVGAGRWRGGYTPEVQAEWAAAFTPLALCKPYVQGAQWAHLFDAEPHQFPNCGLIDAAGQVKPAVAKLRDVREAYLK
jgi:Glycosyl hydrolase family 10